MAEFCKQCFINIEPEYVKNKEIVVSEDDDFCEGCGEFKPVVIEIRKK